jgi:zinc transporter 1/2/3
MHIIYKYINLENMIFSDIIGCLSCVAAGILIYVALVEMVAHDFQSAAIASNFPLKIKMFSALSIGATFLAIIGNWA